MTAKPIPVAPPILGGARIADEKGTIDTAFQQMLVNLQNSVKAPANTVAAPKTSKSAGTPGQIAFDSGFVYVCVGENQWARALLSTSF